LGQSELNYHEISCTLLARARSELLPAASGGADDSCIALNPGCGTECTSGTEADVRPVACSKSGRSCSNSTHLALLVRLRGLAMAKYPCAASVRGHSTSHWKLQTPSPSWRWNDQENHRILENAQFKLSPAAMGAAPGSAWFRHAIDVMQRGESIGQDLSLDGSFPTECHLLWQRKQQQRKQPRKQTGYRQPEEPNSVYLLPWEVFLNLRLRNPDVMLGLMPATRRWPWP
uniref:HA domain-containing protein n=1 Tax=Macrostomum lignano TaxID=282301 RepID=A0A1I8FK81_9PLAT